jgi:enoyl-CoA hydratase/carnithine racemase
VVGRVASSWCNNGKCLLQLVTDQKTFDVLVARSGRLGRITLNRPRSLNALTMGMVIAIDRALSEFEASDVAAVVIDGAGERGLCAGGDIRAFYDAVLAGDPAPRSFWRHEYRLNALIARYPKPTSLKVTLRALRAARTSRSIEECLEREYRISTTFLSIPDFVEGIRAAVIDKDRNPRWNPERLELVTDEMVERFFATRPDELHLTKNRPTV